jgi:hypothetical protein
MASPTSRHPARLSATRIQLLPAVLRELSLHLAWGRPTLRLPRHGLHSKTCLRQWLSVLRLIWPAHCHFSMLIRCAMSVTLVPSRITWFRIRSRRETPSIALSIALWATLNLWTSRAVSVHISAPYVTTGRTHWLKIFVLHTYIILHPLLRSLHIPSASSTFKFLMYTRSWVRELLIWSFSRIIYLIILSINVRLGLVLICVIFLIVYNQKAMGLPPVTYSP